MFETVVERCLAQGLVGTEGFAVDASLKVAAFLICPFPLARGVYSDSTSLGCAQSAQAHCHWHQTSLFDFQPQASRGS